MNCKVEKTKNVNEVSLEITVEAAKFSESIKSVYIKSAKYISIPGFRKGKAPLAIVEKTYGKEAFYEDAFNEMVPDVLEKVIEENKLEVVSRPEIEIITIEKGQDLVFKAIFQTKPEVKLGKYKGVEITKLDSNVSEEEITAKLTGMQEQNARIVSVEEGIVENKDIATIDFDGSVDGVPFDGGKAEGHELEIGSKTFIEGFEEQVIGMKIEEEKDVKVTFPTEYFSEDLAGKDAVFKVKLHSIKKKELPKLDDEFAKDTSDFETLAELKASIKEELEENKKHSNKHQSETEALEAIVKDLTVDVPSGMIEIEVDNMIKDIEQKLSYQGLKLDQYLNMMNKELDDVKEEYKEQAQNAIKSRLALEAIIKEEKIEATAKEIDEKIVEMQKNYGKEDDTEFAKNEQVRDYIKKGIESEKALSLIIENAKEIKAKK